MKKRLLLLRHARPAILERHRFLGRTDVSLDAEGHRQAAALTTVLQAHQPERCLCSPLKRCVETISAPVAFPIEIDADLREIDFGSWEGMTFDEIRQSDPDAVARWAAFDPGFAFPGGESLEGFLNRVRQVAERLASGPEQTVLAVTHGGVIRALLCQFLRLDPRQYVLFDIAYGSLTTLDLFDGNGVLTGLNLRGQPEERQ